MCEFHTKIPTFNRHLQLAAPLAALLCRNSMKRVSQRVFLVKKKWKTSQKLELNSICLFHCRWRKLWRVSKTTAEGKNRVRHKLKGTQSAVGLCWPRHYFCHFEKRLPQPAIKCTRQILALRQILQSCLVVHSILVLSPKTSFWAHVNWSYDIISSYLVKKSIQSNMNRRGENRVGAWRKKSPSFTRTTKKMNQ